MGEIKRITMHTPELLLPSDWPDSPEWWLSNLTQGPSLTLYWPVSWLPEEMGWCHNAVKVEGDPTGGYFLLVGVAFYRDHVAIYACDQNPDGWYPEAVLDYPTLACLIEASDTGVFGSVDSPPAMRMYRPHYDRAFRAWLRLSRQARDETVRADPDPDEMPF